MTSVEYDSSLLSNLKDKVVIITGIPYISKVSDIGGARGIGAATVKFFHSHGAIVEFADLNDTNGHNLQTQLKEYTSLTTAGGNGRRARYTHCDVTSWQSLSSLFKGVHERNGRIDVVVANAGIVERKEFLDDTLTEDGELQQPDISVINVNLVGCMYTGKLALWWFKKNPTPGGALVMISSVGGYADGTSLAEDLSDDKAKESLPIKQPNME